MYVDDFEVCNPLGTSRKTHKLCAVYWVLRNLPPWSHSSLSSIAKHTMLSPMAMILEPLVHNLRYLKIGGIFVPQLGRSLKDTDNLGAHGITWFVENFTVPYFCHFCTVTASDIVLNKVRSGPFSLRTKEIHETYVRPMLDSGSSCFGVKRACPLTKGLSHFHDVSDYTPNIAHDLFEGIVPVEIAHCLTLIILKKYITFNYINNSIQHFPYKWTDKTNKPHILSQNLSIRETIGGNAQENWSLLRLLPFLFGPKIPGHCPA